jgi:kumamolisin
VAGDADPVTGYAVVVDGQQGVIGGTSAVAPLYAGMYAVAKQVLGKSFDLVATVSANPSVCFDVTVGNNGGYAAGTGKDDVSGWGVVDWGRLLAVLTGGTPTPTPTPTPPSADVLAFVAKIQADCTLLADQATAISNQAGALLAANGGS